MEKIKRIITASLDSNKGRDILTLIIIILVGLCSFLLGRLSKNPPSGGIKVEYTDQAGNVISSVDSALASNIPLAQASANLAGKSFYASKKGHKYYSLGCGAGKSIKQASRVYFATADAAEK